MARLPRATRCWWPTSRRAGPTPRWAVWEAVRADLGQSPVVSIVTPQTVASALQRMQRAPNTRVDTAVARDIARREGIKAVVGGDIHSVGSGFIVTLRLVS